MYDPKDVLMSDAFEEYRTHLHNIKEGLFFILNHADDLHIGSMKGDKADEVLYSMQRLLDSNHLMTGDGEKDD